MKIDEFKSAQALKKYLAKYYSFSENRKDNLNISGTSKSKMNVKLFLEEVDSDFFSTDVDDIIKKTKEIKRKYKVKQGQVVFTREDRLWCGDYEGSFIYVLHEFVETDDLFNERMKLVNEIEKEIEEYNNELQSKKEAKELKLFEELSKKYNK